MWIDLPNWQAQSSFVEPVAPPGVEPDAAPLVCLQVNATWIPYVIGSLMQLVQPAAWATTDPTALNTVLQQAQDLITAVGSAEGCSMLTFQFTSECVLQFSTDGGTTWTDVAGWPTDAPGCYTGPEGPAGPAGGFTPGVPPIQPGQTTATLACSVAGYIATEVIQASLGQILSGISAGKTILQIFEAIALIVPGLDVVFPEAVGAINLLYNLVTGGVISDFTAAESDPVLWADITCAIFTNTMGDGYVTSSNFAAVKAAICAISYTSPDVISTICAWLGAMGYAGIAAIQIPGALASVDCAGCEPGPWCYTFNETFDNFGAWAAAVVDSTALGTHVPGTGWESIEYEGSTFVNIEIAFTSTYITSIEVFFTAGSASFGGCRGAGPNPGFSCTSLSASAGFSDDTVAIGANCTGLIVGVDTSGVVGSPNTITGVIVRGTGTCPFGTPNC